MCFLLPPEEVDRRSTKHVEDSSNWMYIYWAESNMPRIFAPHCVYLIMRNSLDNVKWAKFFLKKRYFIFLDFTVENSILLDTFRVLSWRQWYLPLYDQHYNKKNVTVFQKWKKKYVLSRILYFGELI